MDKKDVEENIRKLQKKTAEFMEKEQQYFDETPTKKNGSGMKLGLKKMKVGKRKGWMVW